MSRSMLEEAKVDAKAAQLRAFFPPEVVGWETPSAELASAKDGQAVTCMPFVSSVAIQDRLDSVLGLDGWSVSYSVVGEWVRCVLSVRFEPGGEWVTRVGLGTHAAQDRAHAYALREAARVLGIGRYLTSYPVAVELQGGKYTSTPRLPDEALPGDCRKCGREYGEKIRGLIIQCCDESTRLGKPADKREAARILAYQAGGYVTDEKGNVNFSRVQVRHATAILQRLNGWLAEVIAGRLATSLSPFHRDENGKVTPAPEVGKEKTKDSSPVPTTANPSDSKQPAATPAKT